MFDLQRVPVQFHVLCNPYSSKGAHQHCHDKLKKKKMKEKKSRFQCMKHQSIKTPEQLQFSDIASEPAQR